MTVHIHLFTASSLSLTHYIILEPFSLLNFTTSVVYYASDMANFSFCYIIIIIFFLSKAHKALQQKVAPAMYIHELDHIIIILEQTKSSFEKFFFFFDVLFFFILTIYVHVYVRLCVKNYIYFLLFCLSSSLYLVEL